MRTCLAFIFSVLLVLPLHTLSYVNTVLHVVQHEDEHAEDHHAEDDHSHDHDHDSHAPHADADSGEDMSHRHASDQPRHSHDRDIWGLFSNPGLNQAVSLTSLPAFDFSDPPVFEVILSISDPFSGSLLRPPIA